MINNIDTSSIKYILFDLDGTITDPKIGITKSAQYALSKFNIHVENLDELEPLIGPPIYTSFIEKYKFSEEKTELAVSYYREYFSKKGLFENKPYPGIEETLSALKNSGYHLAIATSKPTIFAEKILDHFDLSQYFEFVVGASLDKTRINKNDIIHECMRLFDDNSNESYIMIGDREHDIIGAKKVGIKSIGVLYGYGSKNELETAGANRIIENHDELLGMK